MRKFLGVEPIKTVTWLLKCENCSDCFDLARKMQITIAQTAAFTGHKKVMLPSTTTIGNPKWDELVKHIESEHSTQELCIRCFGWLEDEEFAEHSLVHHQTIWRPQ